MPVELENLDDSSDALEAFNPEVPERAARVSCAPSVWASCRRSRPSSQAKRGAL